MGADHVELDTLVSFAGFRWDSPKTIDFVAFDDAAADASYRLMELTLILPGEALRDRCEPCDREVWWLALDGVDQRLELSAAPPIALPGRYTLEVHDWRDGHARSVVTGWEPPDGTDHAAPAVQDAATADEDAAAPDASND